MSHTPHAMQSEHEILLQRFEEQTRSLRAEKEKAEQANKLKSEFLANVTHELKTPVHCIINYAQIGIADLSKGRAENLKEYFEDIFANGQRLDTLISDLLDLSKIESGNVDFQLDVYPVRPLLENAIAATRGLADTKNLVVHISGDADQEHVLVDARRMEQVLINLMSNAIRFSPEHGTIDWHLRSANMPVCGSHLLAPALSLVIEDEGPGIPERELESIFDHFVQGKIAVAGGGGTGLGLAICRRFLNVFHGTIRAKNRASGGAEFEIVLPLWHKMTAIPHVKEGDDNA